MGDITPSRIEWRGPGGYIVVLDEDFVSLRGNGPLEEREIDALLEVVNEAKHCRDAGSVPTPKPAEVPLTERDAWAVLARLAKVDIEDLPSDDRIISLARRYAHPDHGGTAETWAAFDRAYKAVRS